VWVRYVLLPIASVVAVVRVEVTPAMAPAPRADAALSRGFFADLRTHELEMRDRAAQDFPTDPWSRDDAFHAYEGGRMEDLAKKRRAPMTDVLAAVDDGMRSMHGRRDADMTPFVPPCHPRPDY
jgi:hypothetical protein